MGHSFFSFFSFFLLKVAVRLFVYPFKKNPQITIWGFLSVSFSPLIALHTLTPLAMLIEDDMRKKNELCVFVCLRVRFHIPLD